MKKPKPGERVPRACEFIDYTENLLDVGCGDGVLALFTKNKVKNLYGIDNDKKILATADKRGYKTSFVNFDTDIFPFKTNFFHTITCLDVIEHVQDPRKILNEIFRVLKTNGLLIITTPNIRFSDHLYKLTVKGIFPKTSLDPALYDGGHFHFFTYNDMNHLLKRAGFKKIVNHELINKKKRGWKGQLLEKIFGKKTMMEFRSPGILITASK